MRVFVTGATGFIGSAVVKDLIAAGHQVVGLCRSDEKALALAASGAEVCRGSVDDVDSLDRGAARSDGVIHLAFNHDFSKYLQNCQDDRRIIERLGSILAGSKRPLIVTSGTAMANTVAGQVSKEGDKPASSAAVPRAASEEAAISVGTSKVNVSVVRLPQVHDRYKQGLVSYVVEIAREKRQSAYLGDGTNRWPAVHVLDTARLYRLALEKAEVGATYHAVAEDGVSMHDIAGAIGRRLQLPVASLAPEEAAVHFGWVAAFLQRDIPSSSAQTREVLNWQPTGPGLLASLEQLQVSNG